MSLLPPGPIDLEALRDAQHGLPKLHQDHVIGPYRVVAFDNIFNDLEQEKLYEMMESASFRRSEYDRYGTRQRSMSVEYRVDRVLDLDFFKRMFDIGQAVSGDQDLALYRAYLNNNSYGDMSYTHRDTSLEDPLITVMAYTAPDWETEWGGETIFYDDDNQSMACILPKFGRVAVFDGTIQHKGGVPSRECYEERRTLVLKLCPVKPSS